ncbi:hypothetical protein C8R43DRAFT_262317 [Mycena crocata]|nr:hypothetical protein C8R43DRAFT_262317 [Mycena crocata]
MLRASQLRWLNATRRARAQELRTRTWHLSTTRCTPNVCCTSTSSHLVALLLSIGSPGDLVVELVLDGEPYMLHTLREREFAPRTVCAAAAAATNRRPPTPHLHRHQHTALPEATATLSPSLPCARCPRRSRRFLPPFSLRWWTGRWQVAAKNSLDYRSMDSAFSSC